MHIEEIKKRIEELGYEMTGEYRIPKKGELIFMPATNVVKLNECLNATGHYFIVRLKKWQPKEGDKVYYIHHKSNKTVKESRIDEYIYGSMSEMSKAGDTFRTEELAKNCLNRMIEVFEKAKRG